MVLPTFIVIGAGRSGTTSLYRYLSQHPQVSMSKIKETRYFAWEAERLEAAGLDPRRLDELYPVRSLAEYEAQFDKGSGQRAVGEASPRYLYVPGVPERIADRLPGIRLIAILREPAQRAFAQYLARRQSGQESRTFERAIEDDIEAIGRPPRPAETSYVLQGLYARHLKRFMQLFGRERMLVALSTDLASRTNETMRAILRFIDVDDTIELDLRQRHNPAGRARSSALDRLLRGRLATTLGRSLPPPGRKFLQALSSPLHAFNTGQRPEMPMAAGERLRTYFREDTQELADLIGRDLSSWHARPQR